MDDAVSLDGDYASFGKVIDGFESIKNIENNEAVEDSTSGKLRNNLVIKKTLIDLQGKEYSDVIKNG